MAADFRTRKIDLEFDLLDVNGNGRLEENDYRRLATRFLEEFGVPRRSRRARAVVRAYDDLWKRHRRDWDLDRDGTITREEYHRSLERLLIRENGFNEIVVPLIKALFYLVDGEERDVLTRAEFARLMGVFGVSESDSLMNFNDLDLDGNDRITLDELIHAFREFYFHSDSASPANRLFGWVY
jgi:Ca2+-binding EF-hand superfamily protein